MAKCCGVASGTKEDLFFPLDKHSQSSASVQKGETLPSDEAHFGDV